MDVANRNLLLWATALGFFAVVLGAFGAHALRDRLDARSFEAFETAVRYQSIHALAIIAVAAWSEFRRERLARLAGTLFVLGVLLFSGSIYGLTLAGWRWLGPVTPLGGLCLSAGWGVFFLSVWRGR